MNNSTGINSHNNTRIKKYILYTKEKYMKCEQQNEFSYSKKVTLLVT